VGSKTGATASTAPPWRARSQQGSEAKRPNVQVGDPKNSLKKLHVGKACLERCRPGPSWHTDMGAAGLTLDREMGARGGTESKLNLDRVRKRNGHDFLTRLCSASRRNACLLVPQKRREEEYSACSRSGDLDRLKLAAFTLDAKMRVLEHGEVVAEIPNAALTGRLRRCTSVPLARWEPPAPSSSDQNIPSRSYERRGAPRTRLWVPRRNVLLHALLRPSATMVQTNTVERREGRCWA